MKLSIVLSARDTNYGGPFVDRFHQALSTNIQTLNRCSFDYEIVVVDYNPINEQYLYKNNKLESILKAPNIKNIIVHNSVVLNENLTPTTFYEYFAKNVGIRECTGDFIFVTNADIILSYELAKEIEQEFYSPDKDNVFYRCRFRAGVDIGNTSTIDQNRILDLHRPVFNDSVICGFYSGDASMFSKNVMFNFAKGYNEELQQHRTEACQVHMDGEILWNCYLRGLKLKFLNSLYYHIDHETGYSQRDNYYHTEMYSNTPDWGAIKYPRYQLAKNVIIIKNKHLPEEGVI